MSELKTTALFAAAAAVSLGLAWAFRPTAILSESELAQEKRGSVIFPSLDPDSAASFRIVRFNEELATLSRLELAKDLNTGLWTLPSADGYPADSADQVSKSASPLVELKVLSTVSTDRGDHALYGVVEPNEKELTASASGVGMLVQVGGAENEILANLIVGKAVEGAENQHYVRVPAEDAVYVVEIDSSVFATEFDKWIKGDILNVRTFDIEFVGLRDYAIVRTDRGYGLARNFDADLAYKDNKWRLQNFVDYTVEGNPSTNQPPEGKVLQDSELNNLRSAIQNLKIVNVRRKPLGLAADLKADKSLLDNAESTKSLQDQGFFPMESGEVFASGGELLVGTKDGVRYLLRFGNTQVSGSSLAADQGDDEESDQGVRRYLLAMAELDESHFPPPELKVVPETIEEMLAIEAAEQATRQPRPATELPAEEAPAELPADQPAELPGDSPAEPSGEAASDQPTADQPASQPASADQPPPTGDTGDSPAAGSEQDAGDDAPAAEAAPQPAGEDAADGKLISINNLVQDEAANAEGDSDEAAAETADTEPPAADESTEVELSPSREPTPEELQERLEFMQESIRKENQRLIDARNESISEARKKVAELNARFADWYYIVSDSVYQKLKISRDALFQVPGDGAASGPPAGNFVLPDAPLGLGLPVAE